MPRVPKNLPERHPSPSSGAFGLSPEAVIASDRFAHILNQFINIWNIIPEEENCGSSTVTHLGAGDFQGS